MTVSMRYYLSAGLRLLTATSRANTKACASIIYATDIVYGINIYAKWRKDSSLISKTETQNDQLPCWNQLFAHSLSVFTPTELLRGSYTRSHTHAFTHACTHAVMYVYTNAHSHTVGLQWGVGSCPPC